MGDVLNVVIGGFALVGRACENNQPRHASPTGPARSGRPDGRLRRSNPAFLQILDCFVAALLAMTDHGALSPPIAAECRQRPAPCSSARTRPSCAGRTQPVM